MFCLLIEAVQYPVAVLKPQYMQKSMRRWALCLRWLSNYKFQISNYKDELVKCNNSFSNSQCAKDVNALLYQKELCKP